MDPNRPNRPRVSRETRLLLTTALVAVAALWLLARIRFPDLPATPSPVPPMLTQLGSTSSLDGLASEVAQLQGRLEPLLVVLDSRALVASAAGHGERRLTALRVRDDLAITFMAAAPPREHWLADRIVASDAASGLVLVRVPGDAAPPLPPSWVPRRLERPRFLVATEPAAGRVALRPAFVSALEPIENALWPEPVWAFTPSSAIVPGSVVFTTTGELAGIAIAHGGARAIVPPALLFAEVERLSAQPIAPAGDLGIRVQALNPDLSIATGATIGVVVTWVAPDGPAARLVAVGDVIEAIDGYTLSSAEHWDTRRARIGALETVTLRVRRENTVRDVQLQAPAVSPPDRDPALGLRLRIVNGSGSQVLAVDPGSAGARAGLAAGDVITRMGAVAAPSPADVRGAFAKAPEGSPLMVAVTRGSTHFVTTLTR
jgi:hypothetical protein